METTVSATNDNSQTHVYNTPGSYDVTLASEDVEGCIDTSYHITIEVGDTVSLDFSANQTSVCPGDSISFTNLTPNPMWMDGIITQVQSSFHIALEMTTQPLYLIAIQDHGCHVHRRI